ncbi:flagellar FliJ protein [Clostridium punense]|uniref:Flagellar FliJ protein n=1 Tax=Clostridium punense TaxID=1054297 RepID=A0ABS4K201_9CLOT|nr:flagellar export protein FliJ [Clostridium punense]MBP2021802.1 flagellar FliJ protein [Clostridium punense]
MANRYNFKLQKLLEIREAKEEKMKVLFMEASKEKQLVQRKLDDLEDNYSKYSAMDITSSTYERKIQQNYLNLLYSSIEDTIVTLDEKTNELEEKRLDLVDAQVQRKTVEILKEKQKKVFLAEQERLEQLQNDEFSLYGFIRQNRR